jgi:hypothetical protein
MEVNVAGMNVGSRVTPQEYQAPWGQSSYNLMIISPGFPTPVMLLLYDLKDITNL